LRLSILALVYLYAFSIRLVRLITSCWCSITYVFFSVYEMRCTALLEVISIEQHSNHLPTTLLHAIKCTASNISASYRMQLVLQQGSFFRLSSGKVGRRCVSEACFSQAATGAALLLCCCLQFSVLRYESVIHEFDPYFNYRSTIKLVTEVRSAAS
jgi:hypothetical protein